MDLGLNRINSSKENIDSKKQKSILFEKIISTKNNLAPIEEIKEESITFEETSPKKEKDKIIDTKVSLIDKKKSELKEEEKKEILSEEIHEILEQKNLDSYKLIVTDLLQKSKNTSLKKKELDDQKNRLLKFFSQICFEIDSHFIERIQELVKVFEDNIEKEEIYLYLVRSFILKVFSDVRERYKSSPITIIYYGTIIVILNSFQSHFVEIILAVIFRKFKILIPEVLDKKNFKENIGFLLDLGFDKMRDVKGDIVAKTNLEDYLEILDAYSMLFFSIIGVNFKNLIRIIKQYSKIGHMNRYNLTHNYLNFLENLMKLDYWKYPFITVVLKNYILASSEVFKENKDEMLKNFILIKNVIIPKLKEYIEKQVKEDFPLLNEKQNFKELEISMRVLEKELEKILSDRKVVDKFIKYDEKVRA